MLFSGFDVSSFGCGTKLKLPGPSKKAREFDFGTPYAEIVRCLEREAKGHYERVGGNEGGVLELARRGAATKEAPERPRESFWHSEARKIVIRKMNGNVLSFSENNTIIILRKLTKFCV